eukprot:5187609-Alexandrium_andersonii.AAC.1
MKLEELPDPTLCDECKARIATSHRAVSGTKRNVTSASKFEMPSERRKRRTASIGLRTVDEACPSAAVQLSKERM